MVCVRFAGFRDERFVFFVQLVALGSHAAEKETALSRVQFERYFVWYVGVFNPVGYFGYFSFTCVFRPGSSGLHRRLTPFEIRLLTSSVDIMNFVLATNPLL